MIGNGGSSTVRVQILVVVETPGIRELIELVITEQAGWDAVLADDIDTALETVQTRRVDALIVEVPFSDTLEAGLMSLQDTERESLNSRVILVSAGPARSLQYALDRRLASRVIEMPFDVDDLITATAAVVTAVG